MSRQIVCDRDQCKATTPEAERSESWRRVFIGELEAGHPILDVEVCSDQCAAAVVAAWAKTLPKKKGKAE